MFCSMISNQRLRPVRGIAADHGTHARRQIGQIDAGGDCAFGRRVQSDSQVGRGPQALEHRDDLLQGPRVGWHEREVDLIDHRAAANEQIGASRRLVIRDLHIKCFDKGFTAVRLQDCSHLHRIACNDATSGRGVDRCFEQLGDLQIVIVAEMDLHLFNVGDAELIRHHVAGHHREVRRDRLSGLGSRPPFAQPDRFGESFELDF